MIKTFEQIGIPPEHSAANGLAACKTIESGKVTPNLIVADFQMPEMNDLKMLKRVRTGGVANLPHDVPFIILTGYLELKRSIPAVRLGVGGLICKPLTPAVAKKSFCRSPPVILRVTFETPLILPTTKSIAAARLMRKSQRNLVMKKPSSPRHL